jgi:hypothetical protein
MTKHNTLTVSAAAAAAASLTLAAGCCKYDANADDVSLNQPT